MIAINLKGNKLEGALEKISISDDLPGFKMVHQKIKNILIAKANYSNSSDLTEQMRKLCGANWDMEDMRGKIASDQKRRLKVHHSTKGDPTYVNLVRSDDAERYIRNAGAADTKAKARLPYVAPARPE